MAVICEYPSECDRVALWLFTWGPNECAPHPTEAFMCPSHAVAIDRLWATPLSRVSVARMQSPSLGRVVLIKVSDTEFAPAFVTKVHNDSCVNVTIFHDGGSVEPRSSVLFGDHSLPDSVNTWAWPPRV